jgi:hypothetical protein
MIDILPTPPARSVELALEALEERLEKMSPTDGRRPEIIRQIRILSDAICAAQPI